MIKRGGRTPTAPTASAIVAWLEAGAGAWQDGAPAPDLDVHLRALVVELWVGDVSGVNVSPAPLARPWLSSSSRRAARSAWRGW